MADQSSDPRRHVLEVRDVSKSFGGIHALKRVNLGIAKSSITALIGPNGAGKTTLVNVISGIYRADQGTVALAARDVSRTSASARARMGIMRTFQRDRTFPQLTVLENTLACHWSRQVRRLPRETRIRALERLEQFGLADYASRFPSALTFADRRRLDFVRCLMAEPAVIMLDEPAAGMNPEEADGFVDHLARLQREEDLTLLLIEHNMQVVMGLADVVNVLSFGEIVAAGSPAEIRRDERVVQAYLGVDA